MTNLTNNEATCISYMANAAMDEVCADTLQEARENYCAPCNHGELATAMGLTVAQARGVVTSLMNKGLVTIDDNDTDFSIELTDEGFDAAEAQA